MRTLAILALALLLPTASAATVAGLLDVPAPAAVEGTLELTATPALAELAGAPATRIAWASATGEAIETRYVDAAGFTHDGEGDRRVPLAFGEGGLTFTCRVGCVARLVAGEQGALVASAEGASALVPHAVQEDARLASAAGGALDLWTDAPWLRLDAPGARLASTGNVTLVLWELDARVETTDGAITELATGRQERSVAGPLPAREVEQRVVVLRLSGATLESTEGALLLARRATLVLDGALESASADGWLDVDGARHELRGDAVRVVGALTLRAEPTGAATALARVEHAVEGEASEVMIGGAVVSRVVTAAGPAAALGGLAALALLLAAIWLLAPLYTRLTKSSLLANANRNAVYEHIRANPGQHVSRISRAVGLGRVVVQHHLRMLEAHKLVVPRRSGRLLAYFVPEELPDAEGIHVTSALSDETRVRIAAMVRASPEGVTQRDLVERTGLGRRLVGYHLERLEAAHLVTSEGFRPRRYLATPRLDAALPREPSAVAA